MQKNILVRSIAALSGIVMLASVAACGDNTATTTDNSSSSDSTSKSTPISGNFSGAGASSLSRPLLKLGSPASRAPTLRPRSPTTRPVPALACRPS